jgi:hypothetical protein
MLLKWLYYPSNYNVLAILVDLAKSCNLAKFKKNKRGVKKPKVDVKLDKSTPHVSTLKRLSGNV